MKTLKISIWVTVILGFMLACVALYVGFQHNPQGEFYDPATGKIDYGYSALLFLSWFLFVGISGTVVIVLGWGFNKLFQRVKSLLIK